MWDFLSGTVSKIIDKVDDPCVLYSMVILLFSFFVIRRAFKTADNQVELITDVLKEARR